MDEPTVTLDEKTGELSISLAMRFLANDGATINFGELMDDESGSDTTDDDAAAL